MANTTHISTTQVKLDDLPIVEGQIIFISDTFNLYWDVSDTKRVQITDVIELNSELERIAIIEPIEKMYFVLSTETLWKYVDGKWIEISGSSEASGNSEKYVNLFTTSDWIGSGTYTINVPQSTHNKGVDIICQLYALDGGSYSFSYGYPTTGYKCSVNSNGDVELSTTDKFSGKIIIF